MRRPFSKSNNKTQKIIYLQVKYFAFSESLSCFLREIRMYFLISAIYANSILSKTFVLELFCGDCSGLEVAYFIAFNRYESDPLQDL